MAFRTRVFELAVEAGLSVDELAERMGLAAPHLYRVRAGSRGIGDGFIEGAKRAFPDKSLDDLFVVEDDTPTESVA